MEYATDHVFPKLPVRQWVLSVPKRLRYFLQRDVALQGAVLRIFLREVERCLREHSPKPGLDGSSDLVLTPLELIGKIAALVPPPRSHRHRYFGVLAPNSPLRAAVIALAPLAVIAPSLPLADSAATEDKPRRAVSHYLWAMLLARIYEAFPLSCPICHAQMRIIAFINEAGDVRKILDHIGESTQPPKIAPARGPPLWELAEASARAGNDPEWDTAEPAPEIWFDQRVAW